MSRGPALLVHQFRYDQKTFWRDPAAVFFTVILPVIFLFLFSSIFGSGTTAVDGRRVGMATYMVPGIIALAIVSATFVNMAVTVTAARERGTLKRLRATPMPLRVYIGARVGTAVVVSMLMLVLLMVVGRLFYDVAIPTSAMAGVLVALVVSAAAFCSLGFALTTVIPSENAAPAVTNAVVLPLYFISGVFIPEGDLPDGMRMVGDLFPVKHMFRALLTAFDPATSGLGLEPGHVAVVAAWGTAGLVVALRTFRWAPRTRA